MTIVIAADKNYLVRMMYSKVRTATLLLALFTITLAYSQKIITARITDEVTGKPIRDAKITVKGKETSANSNALGFFQIQVDSIDVLLIKSPKYELLTFAVPGAASFQIRLKKLPLSIYKSGMNEFYKQLGQTIRYPLRARKMAEEGYTYVVFRIDSLGGLESLKVLSEGCSDCGTEVLRVLRKMPKEFIDDEDDSEYILPIGFRLGTGLATPQKSSELPGAVLLAEFIVTAAGGPGR